MELLIPPPVWIRRLVVTTIGTMIFIHGNNLINKTRMKIICCSIMALKQGSQIQIALGAKLGIIK